MGFCASQLLRSNLLMGHGFHNVWPCHKHIRRPLDHQCKICKRGRVHRSSCTRAEDKRKLRHYPTRPHVAVKNISVSTQTHYPLLNSCPTTVVQPHYRSSILQCEVHDLTNLFRMCFRQRPSQNGKILTENIHQPSINFPISRHHSVP